MTNPATHRCCKEVYPSGMNFPVARQCRAAGKAERDGKWYCAIHDPVAVAKKNEARERKYLEGMNARIRQQRVVSLMSKFSEAEIDSVINGRAVLTIKPKP